METAEIRRRIAEYSYHILYWGQNHVPPGVRSIIGIAFMVGGVFGFLPILGFWMLPLGIAFVALDVPAARTKTEAWIERLRQRAGLEAK